MFGFAWPFSDSALGDTLALGTAISWAFAVLFFKKSGDQLDLVPLKVFQNFLTAFFFSLALLAFGEMPKLNFTPNEWALIVLSSLSGIALGDTLYLAALRKVGAGAQALLDCFYTPSILVLAWVLHGEIPSPLEIVGSILIVTAILVGTPIKWKSKSSSDHWLGVGIGILAQVAIAFAILVILDLLKSESVMTLTALRYLIGSCLFVVGARTLLKKRNQPLRLWAGFVEFQHLKASIAASFLGLFLSTYLWFLAFRYTSPARAAIFTQLSSVFIFLLARIFLGEQLTLRRWFAIVLAMLGGYIVL